MTVTGPAAARHCRGAVAAGHEATAAAAIEILDDGGNAFDAAAAALAASFVVEPALSSPGGGGFLLAHPVGGEPQILDFFAQTPGRREREDGAALDFLPLQVDFGTARQEFHVGRASVAVPGCIPGLCALQSTLCSRPLQRLLEPAIGLARRGWPLAPMQARIIDIIAPILTLTPAARALFAGERPGAATLTAGTPLPMPELADSLALLAEDGERVCRDGPLAQAITSLCADAGLLTAEDLRNYRVQWRRPLARRVLDAQVYSNPPPSAGGPLLLFGLALADTLPEAAQPGELASIMRLTAQARDGCDLDGQHLDALLNQETLAHWFSSFTEGRRALKRGGTTHFSIIDAAGNTAACTVSNGEGCGHMVPGAGFMLNNMLGEEDLNPRGFFRWTADTRVASMMAPTLAERDDGRLLALGSAGSNRIRTALLQVLCSLLREDRPLLEAIVAPRLHVEGQCLEIEGGWADAAVQALCESWPEHRLWPDRSMFFGGVQAVERLPDGRLQAAGDPRRGGTAAWAEALNCLA